MCAVGVETMQKGEFNSLGIYLASSVAMMMFELAYYLDALLSMCLSCPPDWQLFVLWKKMARVGGFHKFLYYFIMSVVCFLHPVLVWHAIIPSMLLVTAIFNFILSKKTNVKDTKISHVCHSNLDLTTLRDIERSDSSNTFPFLHAKTGRREDGLNLSDREHRLSPEHKGEHTQTMLEKRQTPSSDDTGKTRWTWRDKSLTWFRGREELVERELEEMEVYCEPETTSDTAPMIT
uniref:Transmembrane protein 72 n=1 Tax=Oryzias latipes TaxID=8090 RepID=A0A3P9HC74_ORYLA